LKVVSVLQWFWFQFKNFRLVILNLKLTRLALCWWTIQCYFSNTKYGQRM